MNNYNGIITTTFFLSTLVLYIIGLWIHNNNLNKRIKSLNNKNKKLRRKIKRKTKAYNKVKANRDGLVNQYRIDHYDKSKLEKELSRKQIIIKLLIDSLPSKQIPSVLEKTKLLMRLEDNEDSKDNKY